MLDALEALLSSDVAQMTVAQIDWKVVTRSTGSRTPARFAHLGQQANAETSGSGPSSRVREILEADETAVASLLETYILENVARSIGTLPARIDPERSLLDLGLDSLIAMEVRNQINADFGINVPITRFTQSANVRALAAHVAEQIMSTSGSPNLKAANGGTITGNMADVGTKGAPSDEEAADLLRRIDELTDDEVDRHLAVVAAQVRN
jgi:acyl carrier protein